MAIDKTPRPEFDDFSIDRCPHCGEITLHAGDMALEMTRDEFMRLRDRVNEVAMDLPDRNSIYNPLRFETLKN